VRKLSTSHEVKLASCCNFQYQISLITELGKHKDSSKMKEALPWLAI